MHLDLMVMVAGAVVGFVVGLTGMGGGALMTPVLVLLFGVQPLAAVSSDLVASAVMKPVGAGVHLRRGTIHKGLVGWLVLGSVPAAFGGVFVLRALGQGQAAQDRITFVMGVVLVVAALSMAVKSVLDRRRSSPTEPDLAEIRARPVLTVLVGALGGLLVGMTSVGSGSLIVVLLLALHPRMRGSQLVGTDLAQAVPLVAAASLGHLLFGDFQLALTGSLLIGAVPAVYLGARLSSGTAAAGLIRPALVVLLIVSGLKLLGVPTVWLGVVLGVVVTVSSAVAVRARTAAAPAAVGVPRADGEKHDDGSSPGPDDVPSTVAG